MRLLLPSLLICAAGPAAAYEVIEPTTEPGDSVLSVQLTGRFSGTAEQAPKIPVATGVTFDPGTLITGQARLGLVIDARFGKTFPIVLHGEIEAYAFSGQQAGTTDVNGIDMPADQSDDIYLRTAFARVSLANLITVGAGVVSFEWGLGLLANGGVQRTDWDAEAAQFSDPYLPDTNLRLLLATGPHGDLGVQVFGFRDTVQVNDSLRPGDDATQAGGGIRMGKKGGLSGGLLVVQRTIDAPDSDSLTVNAIDATMRYPMTLDGGATLTLEGELAYLEGETSFAPSFDHRTRRVQQLGAAVRARLHAGKVGLVIDGVYASGDRNLADGEANNFLADRNYEMGLLLYRYVNAAQSGYAPTTASDPNLIGVPPEDVDRFPTRGGISNTVAFFPRLYYRPLTGLEIYGGPLIAFSEVPIIDPLNTNFAGGSARNALDGAPSRYMGTELDLGIRGQWSRDTLQLRAGIEGAVLLPGGAFNDADGVAQGAIFGGRLTLEAGF
ncbi:MAG: hypothetical protein ACI9U2_005276 [Bradymonadia bacterium]|jgi:hypothetical protein